jgi:hypothetical protein
MADVQKYDYVGPFSLQSALLFVLVAVGCNRELHNTHVLRIKI